MDKVIIDGIDVSECKHFGIYKDYQFCNKSGINCEELKNCYYKQLQRLQAENEKLKTDIGIYKGIIDSDKAENERLKDELRVAQMNRMTMFETLDIVEEKDTYKQALQKIRDKLDFHKQELEECLYNPIDAKIREIINSVIGAE